MIILEFLGLLSFGAVLLFYTCRCAISLIKERRNPDTKKNAALGMQTSGEEKVRFLCLLVKMRIYGKYDKQKDLQERYTTPIFPPSRDLKGPDVPTLPL